MIEQGAHVLTAAEAGALFDEARQRYTMHWGMCAVRAAHLCPTCAALEAIEDRYAGLYGLLFAADADEAAREFGEQRGRRLNLTRST